MGSSETNMNTSLFTSHGFELSDDELSAFEKFLALFIEYNSHTNLSAIRDEEGIVEKHFVDSLYGAGIIGEALTRHVEVRDILPKEGEQDFSLRRNDEAFRLLDIGSGWGFPGIPLQIVMPELHVTLLDSVGKKVKAMNHFIEQLELQNITAIQERAEILAKNPLHAEKYDFVVSRATAYITEILTWARPFLAKWGKIVLYKMPSDEERRDREKILKKLGLILEGELEYELGGKRRVIYVIGER